LQHPRRHSRADPELAVDALTKTLSTEKLRHQERLSVNGVHRVASEIQTVEN
jgi:hypothetical protein